MPLRRGGIATFRRKGTSLFTAFAEACRLLRERVGAGQDAQPRTPVLGLPAFDASALALGVPASTAAAQTPLDCAVWRQAGPFAAAAAMARSTAAAAGAQQQQVAAGTLLPAHTNAVVLLTDGEAGDPLAFTKAHSMACCADVDFKAFLVSMLP